MIWEGVLLGFLGGVLGSGLAALFFHLKRFTFGNEGLTLALTPSLQVTANGLLLAVALGLLASLWPAWVACRNPIVSSLRQG